MRGCLFKEGMGLLKGMGTIQGGFIQEARFIQGVSEGILIQGDRRIKGVVLCKGGGEGNGDEICIIHY